MTGDIDKGQAVIEGISENGTVGSAAGLTRVSLRPISVMVFQVTTPR